MVVPDQGECVGFGEVGGGALVRSCENRLLPGALQLAGVAASGIECPAAGLGFGRPGHAADAAGVLGCHGCAAPEAPTVKSRESMTQYFQAYGTLAGLLVLAIGFVALALGVNWALRPHRPTPGKLTPYESGMQPIGTSWSQTQIRYYVFAFLFVIFDVESVFLFPWALVFPGLGVAALWEMVVFIAILAVGLLYAFRKGVLKWV